MEVFVDASVETCESRDVKGLYKQAREGIIPNFTGISDPYEEPLEPDIHIKTDESTLQESIAVVLEYLENENYI